MPEERTKQRSGITPDTPDWFKDFINYRFNTLAKEVQDTKEVVDRGDDILRGENGNPGLLTRFEILERRVTDVFNAGEKIFLFVVTGGIGIIFFIVTSVLGAIIYFILRS
jgi:hypothetical protein